ncbi:hypothetical protein [Pyrococcus yayanosii]|uniref:Uncharacterized protein n=1 Tax=Pyrococcus yayanosii (strain CH1 / JCM 16557) TaxID=529709 RepID=F8AHV5_PYRYC|nr:hypothetical protein [Pyrococcus yayanosii]AEH24241.1 hypothetical protein PYCH_05530 [Pyrococcus yayanosii CH1]
MKRKTKEVTIDVPLDSVRKVLSDPAQFIMNWPYVVRVSTKNGITAEISLPRFLFKFNDIYRFAFHEDRTTFIYDGSGKKSDIIVTVTLKKWQRNVSGEIEVAYHGRGEFFLGKTLELLAEGIAKSLKELAKSYSPPEYVTSSDVILQVDFADPMSVANFLAKAKMIHSGLHMIENRKFFDVLMELKKTVSARIIYISGITPDGNKAFKVLIKDSQILALEHRDGVTAETIKVDDEETARKVFEILSRIEGTYMINIWVPVGGE